MSNFWQIIELFGVTNLSNLRVRAPFILGRFFCIIYGVWTWSTLPTIVIKLGLARPIGPETWAVDKLDWFFFQLDWNLVVTKTLSNPFGLFVQVFFFLTKFAQWPTCSTSHQITQSLVWINTRALLVAVVAAIHNLLSICILNSTLLKAMEVFSLILLYLPLGFEFVRFCF